MRGALEAESGLNDAPTVLLVTLVSTGEVGEKGLLYFSGLVLYELVVGALFGFLIGWLSVGLIRRIALGSAGLYPLAVLSLAIISYAGGTVLLHVSGFAAVYVTSLVLGRAELPHRMATRSFVDGIAWLAQIGLFVMLGLLASPGRFRLNDVLLALVIGIAVTVVGRFASVAVSATPFRLPWREQTFIAWAGLRGAVPIVLATIPLAEGVPQADRIFDVVFVLVLLFTLLQGPSLPWLARRLGVLDENAAHEVDIDVAPLESLGADMLQVHVPERVPAGRRRDRRTPPARRASRSPWSSAATAPSSPTAAPSCAPATPSWSLPRARSATRPSAASAPSPGPAAWPAGSANAAARPDTTRSTDQFGFWPEGIGLRGVDRPGGRRWCPAGR